MSDHERNSIVSVGGNTQLSFHQLQDIYNSLTGKTEKISKNIEQAFLMNFEDLAQLNFRIAQCCESYGAKIKNENLSVFHVNGFKEVFSSFDRFKLYNKSNMSPVESLVITYNIIIIPSGSNRAVPYKILIELNSIAGMREKKRDLAYGPIDIFTLFINQYGRISIDYVDYAVARHFMTQIEEWYKSLDFTPEKKIIKSLQKSSHWIRDIIISLTIACISISSGIFSESTFASDGKALIIKGISLVFAASTLGWLLGSFAGKLVERSIDQIQPISYLKLNRGDDVAIGNWHKKNKNNIIYSIFGIFFAIILNLISSYIFWWASS
ncbi:hypothetical protein [Stappia indica]|uniref:hypothetical protein n=1 Tax=Stappia indica TaxID=538381 RepID=UPI001D181945|nr:hypothetical protein [Stappia indica]MCC4247077.1 hypothetical protein [Stappia indica]